MIVLPITRQEVRAMHGSAAALPVLAVLGDEPGMGLSLEFLATATGYESRAALVKACRLLRLLNLVEYEEPRANALRNIRLTAAVQLPLPATHTLPAGTAGQLTGERQPDTGNHNARENFSRDNFSHGVGVVVNQIGKSIESQQQHQPRNSHERWRAAGLLKALGMWPNVADGLADSDLGEVLGWTAYAHDPANRIANRPALVANALKSERQVGGAYRPHRICQACRRIETVCECETPELYWPGEYDQLALQAPAPGWGETAEDWLRRRWFCPRCLAFPCQCQEAE